MQTIINKRNTEILQYLINKNIEQKKFMDDPKTSLASKVTHIPSDICSLSQVNENEMICILNINYDPLDIHRRAHIFLPQMKEMKGNATQAIIFFIGGCWNSCNMEFAASMASSFIAQSFVLHYIPFSIKLQ